MNHHADTVESRGRRMRNALWGLFIGDALAMPAHWFYSLKNIRQHFDGGIRGYEPPPHPHPESFMVGMTYHPDVETANRLGRRYDILHAHARFYETSYSDLAIQSMERESEHGNQVPRLTDRFHYHHGLAAGENTLGAHLVRVLLRSVIRMGRYDPQDFLEAFVKHLTTPGENRDPYTEIYLRRWFENYSRGLPPHACAELQRNVWSIGSHGGVVRPLVLAMLVDSAYQGLGFAIEHQCLTHRSENVGSALGILVPLLNSLMKGADPVAAISSYAKSIRVPQVTGEELFAAYREHGGPGNIPKNEMWQLHVKLADTPYEMVQLARQHTEPEVVRHFLATACYPEHGLPLLLYLFMKHDLGVEASLLANANAGGDNVHRGMIMGLIAGASHDDLPNHLIEGLMDQAELKIEIDAFVDIAVRGDAI
ncbi:ADP-ribosylglycohydrolase family protein [Nitrosospira sp. NpAV]|uniref:ADP-ribosylglycohydrolase family protein n=1 Tax=Nitrosospira sp. NpAV TaxID=58133 RepID=UPI000696A345|nr:ADP-ribosylglycohydrolase family protein [Nitrosospira sp. NpAV]